MIEKEDRRLDGEDTGEIEDFICNRNLKTTLEQS